MDGETRYAQSGDAHIAFQARGEGPVDIVYIPHLGSSDVESRWDTNRLGSGQRTVSSAVHVPLPSRLTRFARVIMFDKRGTGLSGRVLEVPTFEQQMDDVVAVMDAVQSTQAFVIGVFDGAVLAALFAASHPQRTRGLSAFMRMWADMDIRPVLPTIRVPTLVLQRAEGVLVHPEVGRYVARAIGGAQYVEVAGSANLIERTDVDGLTDRIEEFVTGARPLHDADRVLATVLFTDIVDSTGRAAELGDRGWQRVLAGHDAIVRQELARYRGDEIKTMGDAFLARFDGPGRAVQCARAIRDALRGIDLEIRVGVHTGDLELVENDVSGIAVTIGKRIESMARPGEVLVSRTVVDLVAGSGLEFEDRGEHQLKGVPGNWQLFAVAS